MESQNHLNNLAGKILQRLGDSPKIIELRGGTDHLLAEVQIPHLFVCLFLPFTSCVTSG